MSNISDLVPAREATFFILLSLSNNDKHGYAILKDVATLSSGRVQLSTSTLYEALARLLNQGLVTRITTASDDGVAQGRPGRPRKFYRLTQTGRRVLNAELARLQELVTSAQRRLALLGGR